LKLMLDAYRVEILLLLISVASALWVFLDDIGKFDLFATFVFGIAICLPMFVVAFCPLKEGWLAKLISSGVGCVFVFSLLGMSVARENPYGLTIIFEWAYLVLSPVGAISLVILKRMTKVT